MISIMMYGRRFFPYYTNTVITGLDVDGKGCVYAFDPVGSMTKQLYACEGSAMPLILPILDANVSHSSVVHRRYWLSHRVGRSLAKTPALLVKWNEPKKKRSRWSKISTWQHANVTSSSVMVWSFMSWPRRKALKLMFIHYAKIKEQERKRKKRNRLDQRLLLP